MRTLVFLFVMNVVAVGANGQTAPTAVIDTTAGRLTCVLLTRERPATTAHFMALAEGAEPFYEGARIAPSSSGISVGARAGAIQKASGSAFPAETDPPLLFDRAGLLAMVARKGDAGSSRLLITDHANKEVDGEAVVFGQCDEASVRLVSALRHALQSTDNHPAVAVTIRHIVVVAAGAPVPTASPVAAMEDLSGAAGERLAPLAGLKRSGPKPTGPTAILETSAGPMACRLFTKESPIATSTFLSLADGTKDWTDPTTHAVQHHHRFYDGMAIDRVLPDFYIQFGDITGDISGDTDIGFRFKNENTPGLTFDRPGRLAFGNGGPDTNNSEMFFALNPMHVLDGGYTIVGQCDAAAILVLDRIAQMPRDASNHPLTPVVIRRITVKP